MLIKKGVIDWLFQYFAGQKKFQDYEGSNLCIVRFNRQLANLNRFVNHIDINLKICFIFNKGPY